MAQHAPEKQKATMVGTRNVIRVRTRLTPDTSQSENDLHNLMTSRKPCATCTDNYASFHSDNCGACMSYRCEPCGYPIKDLLTRKCSKCHTVRADPPRELIPEPWELGAQR